MADVFVVTANRTEDGSVAYLRVDHTWTSVLQEAATTEDPEERDRLLAFAADQEHEVCDPYAMTVDVTRQGPVPQSARERIRAGGPAPVLAQWGYAQSDERPSDERRTASAKRYDRAS